METALLGHFEKRVMKRAKTTTIVDQKCNDFNIMVKMLLQCSFNFYFDSLTWVQFRSVV